MKDVKSGSENVKNIFRVSMDKRTPDFLSKLSLSNDEIVETYRLALNEQHRRFSFFVRMLIKSQKGPFNDDVINRFVKDIGINGITDLLVDLIRKSDGNISKETKYDLMRKAIHFDANSFDVFVNSGEAAKFGFDLDKEPWKRATMLDIVNGKGKTHLTKNQQKLYTYLDKMDENTLFAFYSESARGPMTLKHHSRAWTEYPRTTGKIIKHFVDDYILHGFRSESEPLPDYLAAFVKHPNCPDNIRLDLYEKTGDESLLPEEVQDIFVF